jgi:hypothetical protein
MNVYTLPDGSTVTATDQFEIGNQKYPPGWLESAASADIAAAGITVTVVADPPAPPPTSVQVNSTSTPALDGVYAFDPLTQEKLMAVSLYIQVNGKFPDAQTAFPWADASGTMHNFPTTAQFQTFASALADYATALAIGQTPMAPVTIP